MIFRKRWFSVGVLMAIVETSGFAAGWPKNEDMPAACEDAHNNYSSGNLSAMTKDIVGCLQDQAVSDLVKKNIFDLLETAFKSNSGNLPGDFRLPSGLKQLRLVQRRSESPRDLDYIVEFKGKLEGATKIKELKLIRYPDEVLIDRKDAQDEWGERDGKFYLKRPPQGHALPDGLYKVEVEMEGGGRAEQWIPIVDWASDKSPRIKEPNPGQILDTPNPTFSWQAFSTGDRGYNYRGFGISAIASDSPDYGWNEVWSLYGDEGEATSYVVGRESNGHGVAELSKGRHLVVLVYNENRRFGELIISKASSARQAFFVKK